MIHRPNLFRFLVVACSRTRRALSIQMIVRTKTISYIQNIDDSILPLVFQLLTSAQHMGIERERGNIVCKIFNFFNQLEQAAYWQLHLSTLETAKMISTSRQSSDVQSEMALTQKFHHSIISSHSHVSTNAKIKWMMDSKVSKSYLKKCVYTTINFPLFSGLFASLSAATVFAPEDIPTYRACMVS